MSGLSRFLLAGLLDDAAIFPPGNAPLAQAVADHAAHRRSPYAAAVGPLVVRASDLADVGETLVNVVVGLDEAHAALTAAGSRLRALEVVLPPRATAEEVRALASLRTEVYVEVPRDARRASVLTELGATGLRAKFRTGGVTPDLHPSAAELASGIALAVALEVPFKATAGLHRAICGEVDGVVHHGFVNLLLATARARAGLTVEEVAGALALHDEAAAVHEVAALEASVRESFRSFGTCSIREPLADLARLGLLPATWEEGAA